ncbi:hypothetical protein [uncultured Lactobacillus sp.]|uniref:hypothetical protein n=1 Tax=uncultured Lactobacillus sp. TaxID=153152 RepID=UPI0025900115|nr:hypothetical protein [uncultured Lactobacillus sp.]
MKVKKLEKKLNKLSKYYKVNVVEATQFGSRLKGELAVFIREKSRKNDMWAPIFYLDPPHETLTHQSVKTWTLGTKTHIDFWTPEGLKFYIEALQLAEKFLSDKEK